MIQPPTTGPTVGANTANTPANVVARPCREIGKSRNTAEKTAGISVPPEKPCKIRQAISAAKFSLAAQPSDASVKVEMARTTASASSARA